MAERSRTSARRWFGHGRTRALLAAGLLVGTGAVATSAYWARKTTITGVSLTSGAMNIDLAANNKVKPETYDWSTGLVLTNLTAGTSKAATIAVSNHSDGPVKLTYGIKSAATNTTGTTLAGALQVTIRLGGAVSGGTCTGGTLIGAAGTAINSFNQSGVSTLSAGQSNSVCVQVTLPTGSTATGAANVSFTFPANQVP